MNSVWKSLKNISLWIFTPNINITLESKGTTLDIFGAKIQIFQGDFLRDFQTLWCIKKSVPHQKIIIWDTFFENYNNYKPSLF